MNFSYFQICANGLVSFDKPFLQPKPSQGYEQLQNEYILAPFYASMDMESQTAGSVFYRVLDLLNSYDNVSSVKLKELVKNTPNVPNDFVPSTVLVVTWDKVLPRQRTLTSATV